MPRTMTFPAPSAAVCPICDAPLAEPTCRSCGAHFASADGRTLWRIDHDLHDLCATRKDVVERLLASVPSPLAAPAPTLAAAPAAAPTGVPSTASPTVGPLPGGSPWEPSVPSNGPASPVDPPPPGGAPAPGVDRPAPSVASLLVGLGALSLVVAVVVFTAVTWSDLAAWAQGAIIVGLSGLAAAATIATRRRGMVATAEALGAVTVALGLADVHVVRTALVELVEPRSSWAVGLAVLAVGLIAGGSWSRVRTPSLAGTALAFLPAPLLAVGFGPTPAMVALAAQAVVASAVLARVDAPHPPDARPRPIGGAAAVILAVGAGGSWVAAAVGSFGLTIAAVVDDPWSGRLAPLAVLTTLSVASMVVGVVVRRPGLVAAGAGLAFLPLLLALLESTPAWVVVGSLLVQTAVAVGAHPRARYRVVARVVAGGGATSWTVAVVVAGGAGLVDRVRDEVTGPTWATGVLLGAAAVAVGSPIVARWRDREVVGPAFAAGAAALLGAVASATVGLSGGAEVAVVIGSSAAVAVAALLGARVDGERPWSAGAAVGLTVGGALSLVPLTSVLGVLVALVERAGSTPAAGADSALASWLEPAFRSLGDSPTWATVVQLVGVATLAGAVTLARRRVGLSLVAAVAAALVVVVPVVAGVAVGVTAFGLGVLLVAAAVVVHRLPARVEPVLLVATVAVLGALVAVASVPTVIGWAAVASAVAGVIAVVTLVDDRPGAAAWTAAAAATALAATGAVAWAVDAPGGPASIAFACVAALGAPVALLVERAASSRSTPAADSVLGVAGAGLILALAGSSSADAASVVLVLLGVAGAIVAVRPRWRAGWLIAVASGVLVTWVRLGDAGVAAVEAYTLPLAAAALAVGLVEGRGRGSWERLGAGLVAAVAPTALLATVDADPLRSVVVVVGATALVLWGATARLRAPLAIGSVALVAVSLRHLAPVAAEVPRYVGFGVAGLVLLVVGATFEQRRSDVRSAREAYARMG